MELVKWVRSRANRSVVRPFPLGVVRVTDYHAESAYGTNANACELESAGARSRSMACPGTEWWTARPIRTGTGPLMKSKANVGYSNEGGHPQSAIARRGNDGMHDGSYRA